MKTGDLFQDIPAQLPEEVTECLLTSGKLRIERIVSRGHCSEKDVWYDQDQDEWVIVLRGEARVRFAEMTAACICAPACTSTLPRMKNIASNGPSKMKRPSGLQCSTENRSGCITR
jgi:cupin 2 domain-containing protein